MHSIAGYSVGRAIRQEPWGMVYAAEQDSLKRQVEIHILGEHLDEPARADAVEAVRRSAALGLAAVAFCVDASSDGTWFVLEAPGGKTLAEALEDGTLPDPAEFSAALLTVWDAVHSRDVLSGAVRADSVHIRPDGSPCLSVGPFLRGTPVTRFERAALPWLPSWVIAGDEPYDLRSERAAVATLVAAVLTGAAPQDAVAALQSGTSYAAAALLLADVAAGRSDVALTTIAATLRNPGAGGRAPADNSVGERPSGDPGEDAAAAPTVVDDGGPQESGSDDRWSADPDDPAAPGDSDAETEHAAAASEPFVGSDPDVELPAASDPELGDDEPHEAEMQGDQHDPHGRATFAGEIDLDSMIDIAGDGATDSDPSAVVQEIGEEHTGTAQAAGFGVTPAEHIERAAAEKMLERLRTLEEWIDARAS